MVNFFLKKDLNGGVDCADEEEAADEPSEAGEHKEGVGQDGDVPKEDGRARHRRLGGGGGGGAAAAGGGGGAGGVARWIRVRR